MKQKIKIRKLTVNDFQLIESAFKAQGWNKPAEQYQGYFKQQLNNERIVFLAFIEEMFCGYVTVKWVSDYSSFREREIPEISDLNVLKKQQKQGIGKFLIKAAEKTIFTKSNLAGLGVGLLPDYGAAQKLYSKLGYKPDGLGITYQNRRCEYHSQVEVNDDLILWMIKAKE